MSIPTKPSIRQTHRGRPFRAQRDYYRQTSSSTGSFGYSTRLIWSFIKIGFMILGAIAVVILVGMLLLQFIRATVPWSLIALAMMGLITWIIIKNS